MSKPVVVSIPHSLGKAEARRRVKAGFASAPGKFGHLLTIEHQSWADDYVEFQVRALGQIASGTIDVGEETVCLKVELPWLLARLAEGVRRVIGKEGTLLLERKR